MRRVATNILILALSLSAALVAAELLVRIISPQSLHGSWKQESKTGAYWVNRDSGESSQQFRNRSVRYQFGPHHLRIGPTRSKATNKILVLGDSFTFGSLLTWDDTYVGRLQQASERALGPGTIEFLNAATTGWGTADYVAYYEDYGDTLGAKSILVFLNTDDIGRSTQSGIYAISGDSGSLQRQPAARLPGSRLKRLANAIPFYDLAIERSHLLQLMRHVVTMPTNPTPAALSVQWENTFVVPRSLPDAVTVDASQRLAKALFQHLFRIANARNHKVIVLTTGWHKFGRPDPNEPTAAFMQIADQYFKDNGVYFFDLSEEVYRRSNGTLAGIIIEDDFHPNEAGARLISDVAWEALYKVLR